MGIVASLTARAPCLGDIGRRTMDYDFDELAGDELDFDGDTHDADDALSLLLAEHPANEAAAIWD